MYYEKHKYYHSCYYQKNLIWMKKKKQDYWHKDKITHWHYRHKGTNVKKYQVLCLKKPSIKWGNKIIQDKYRQHRKQNINKKTKIGMQNIISSIHEKYFLNKHWNHQCKGNEYKKRLNTYERITFTRSSFTDLILKKWHNMLVVIFQ